MAKASMKTAGRKTGPSKSKGFGTGVVHPNKSTHQQIGIVPVGGGKLHPGSSKMKHSVAHLPEHVANDGMGHHKAGRHHKQGK